MFENRYIVFVPIKSRQMFLCHIYVCTARMLVPLLDVILFIKDAGLVLVSKDEAGIDVTVRLLEQHGNKYCRY